MKKEVADGRKNLLNVVYPQYAEDERLWTARLGVPQGREVEEIRRGLIVERLGLQGPSLETIQRSVEKSQWMASDGHMVEIPDFRGLIRKIKGTKLPGGMRINPTSEIILVDVDDTILRTTAWHAREYEIIGAYFDKKGVRGGAGVAKELYESSKILIPGLVDVQPRYTPRLNLILVQRYIERYKEFGGDIAIAFAKTLEDRELFQQMVSSMGEGILEGSKFDRQLLSRLINHNPTSDFTNAALIKDLFNGESDMVSDDEQGSSLSSDEVEVPDSTVRIVITRGKIEGPLGQVYKVHQSGLMTLPSVDLVIYTNDIKFNALSSVMDLLPDLSRRNERMVLYDDNPTEIIPVYEELAKGPCPLSIEVVQVRHSDSKRRDKLVIVKNDKDELEIQEPSNSFGYRYSSDDKSDSIESFKEEVPFGVRATIFDHHRLSGKAIDLV